MTAGASPVPCRSPPGSPRARPGPAVGSAVADRIGIVVLGCVIVALVALVAVAVAVLLPG